MTMKSERIFLIILVIMMVVLLSSCTLLDKLRGGNNPHADILIIPPSTLEVETPIFAPTASEDVRG